MTTKLDKAWKLFSKLCIIVLPVDAVLILLVPLKLLPYWMMSTYQFLLLLFLNVTMVSAGFAITLIIIEWRKKRTKT